MNFPLSWTAAIGPASRMHIGTIMHESGGWQGWEGDSAGAERLGAMDWTGRQGAPWLDVKRTTPAAGALHRRRAADRCRLKDGLEFAVVKV